MKRDIVIITLKTEANKKLMASRLIANNITFIFDGASEDIIVPNFGGSTLEEVAENIEVILKANFISNYSEYELRKDADIENYF